MSQHRIAVTGDVSLDVFEVFLDVFETSSDLLSVQNGAFICQ